MKQIVQNDEKKETIIELKDFEFNSDKIYILNDDEGYYYLLVKDVFTYKYDFFCLEMRVQWDDWMPVNTLIEKALEMEDTKIYEFDSFNEFIIWYIEREDFEV